MTLKRIAALAMSAALASPVALTVTSTVDQTPKAHASRISPWGTKAAKFALKQRGKPYVFGATGPGSYDCSGLIQAAYKHAGIKLPRQVHQQLRAGHRVSLKHLHTGDLVFQNKGHVAIYYGNHKIVAAPHTGAKVHSSQMYAMKYAVRIGPVSAWNRGHHKAPAHPAHQKARVHSKKTKTPVRPWAKKATTFALDQRGKHYPHGLTHGAYLWHSGLKRFPTIPRQHYVGHRIKLRKNLRRGDIVITKYNHTGLYVGKGRYVYSLHKGGLVKVKKVGKYAVTRRVGNISAWHHGYHKKPAHT